MKTLAERPTGALRFVKGKGRAADVLEQEWKVTTAKGSRSEWRPVPEVKGD